MKNKFYSHPAAIVESEKIGEGTRVWAFAHVLPGAVVGKDCNLCDHIFIENDVILGDRVTIKSGVQLWDGITLEDDVFVGPNASFTNDPFPRSKKTPEKFSRTIVRKGASIGANATLLPGLVIGMNAMVGAGSVVTKDVPPNAIVFGNPARITGYVSPDNKAVRPVASREAHGPSGLVGVPGVQIHALPVIDDLRGTLSFGEIETHLPFVPKRYFLVYDVPSKEVRGEHAHKALHQFLVCVRGSCSVMVDDGENRDEIILDTPGTGLHIPPMVWAVQYKYTPDAVLLVLASDVYKAEDYVRDYYDFLKLKGITRP